MLHFIFFYHIFFRTLFRFLELDFINHIFQLSDMMTFETMSRQMGLSMIKIFLWYYISVGIRTAPDRRPVLRRELVGEMTELEVQN